MYERYYSASLKSLQYDHHLTLSWGIITDNKVASVLAVEHNSIHLVLWNSTIVSIELSIILSHFKSIFNKRKSYYN